LNGSIVLQLDGMGPLYRQIYRAFRNDILTRACHRANKLGDRPLPLLLGEVSELESGVWPYGKSRVQRSPE
jgi:hypothetical protein